MTPREQLLKLKGDTDFKAYRQLRNEGRTVAELCRTFKQAIRFEQFFQLERILGMKSELDRINREELEHV